MMENVLCNTETDDEDEDDFTAVAPTEVAYPELQQAYEWFNWKLFDNTLPDCLITMSVKGRSNGYYWNDRFESADGKRTAELGLNPEIMKLRSDRLTLSTLVHEMVHGWQYNFGTPSRSGYHNKEWAEKMDSVGLMPSHTGQPGGKRTGQSMSHYIKRNGPFDKAATQLIDAGFKITWKSAPHEKKKPTRTKYVCPSCRFQLWGKSGGHPGCLDCSQPMEEQTE